MILVLYVVSSRWTIKYFIIKSILKFICLILVSSYVYLIIKLDFDIIDSVFVAIFFVTSLFLVFI